MLLSMTGFGEATAHESDFSVHIEVRSLNNRYLKVTVRGSDPYPMAESELEKLVRKHVKRGTVHVHVRVERPTRASEVRLNSEVLKVYLDQIREICHGKPELLPPMLSGVLSLPGVAPEPGQTSTRPEEEWPFVEKTLEKALAQLDSVRRVEGQAMAEELLLLHRHILQQVGIVREQLPHVMGEYRQRLLERVRQALSDTGVTIEPEHLIRELALFSDRTDVAEELTRLESHLKQYEQIIQRENDGPGRRLEFVVQELGRETNTLGSKAGDVTISRAVVEIKSTLEKIRELVQNVE